MGSKKTLKSLEKRLLEVDPVQKESDIDVQKNQQARMSWKLKYELINADQFNNGTEDDKDSSDEEDVVDERRESADEKKPEVIRKEPKQKTTVIAGLSGYLSTSDSNDCSSDEEVDIQREVQAFLKEVDSIKLDVDGNPLKSSFEKKTEQKCSSEAAAIDQQHQAMRDYYAAHGYTMPSTSWQECYDASSGYSYYWNTDTNEVRWEIPAEYQFYISTVKQQWEEYHRALYSSQYSTSSQSMVHPSRIATSTPLGALVKSANNVNQSAGITSKGSSSSSHSKKALTQVSPKAVSHAKGKRKEPHHSDSDDEKIELITSYGPNSDDQSSEEEEENVKAKKRRHSHDSKDQDSSHPCSKKKSYKSRTPPPGVDEDLQEIEKQIELKKRQASRQEDVKKLLALKKEEAIRNKKKQLNASEEDPARKQSDVELSNPTTSASSPDSQNVPLLSYKPELPSEENVPSPGEAELVERLKSQAELLKRLGGELPEGVSQIIAEKPSEAESKKGSSLVPGYGEDADSESDDKVSPDVGKEVCEPKTITMEDTKETVTKLLDKDDKTKQDVKQIAAAGERVSKRVLKLSAKAKQLINASETTKRARQTDFVNTPLGLRPADPSNIEHLDGTPICLDEEKSKNENESSPKNGLGYSLESSENVKSSQLVCDVPAEIVKEEGESSIGDKEISIQDCSELLQGKMKFLCEGKEPPSPVQIWAEQLEILFKAWESKQLKDEFLSHWLQTISERLTQLESTAAPPGWLCLWSSYC